MDLMILEASGALLPVADAGIDGVDSVVAVSRMVVAVSELLTCNMCEDLEQRFQCPYDKVGIALMSEHLREQHGITDQTALELEERWE